MPYIKPFSYDDFLTYKIQEGDTPESVAEKLDIDLYALRSYHNRYCESVEDCIGPTFPRYLKFLIIQSQEEKEKIDAHREPIQFSTQNFKLPFLPSHLNKRYLAMYDIEKGSEKNSIKEEINVKWLATDKNGYSLIEIDRKALFVNENYEKSMADELAEKTAKVFYPIKVIVDSNGKCIDINNFDEIRERWNDVKKEVLKEFEGEVVEERLKAFELKLCDNDIIRESFLNDWFLRAFFNGLNVEYKESLTINNVIGFPISKKIGEVKFEVEQTIMPKVDQYNLVNITQKGVLVDERSKDDFENNLLFPYDSLEENKSEQLEAIYEAYYFLNPNTNTVESLFLECEIKLDIPQKIAITISGLEETGKLILDGKIKLHVPMQKKEPSLFREFFWIIVLIVTLLSVLIWIFLKLQKHNYE
ncbi:hypothetical protein [Flavobacterium fluviale]|uniref:LysM domain-containing protein n=1 Tax=Flavobacterium fluviale TaxID=2249356 RepID=A0A344LQ67_9FLAO|nr:hypothetical protein [Flavobacterium fluviale]AXB56059.1 hypothetical protein HYN86_05370 [Flavobacterium fluviale]